MEPGHVGGSGMQSAKSMKSTASSVHEDEFVASAKEPSSPSSSSDSSFDEAFFYDDEGEPRKSNVESPHAIARDQYASIELVSSAASSPRVGLLQDSPLPSPGPSSPIHSSQQSPVIQTMERTDVPDPNRIPSSIFARNKSTAPEWSMQSNESLFSIQMGNNSFSKDQLLLMGKSQELGKSDDIFKFPNNSSELNSFPSPPGPKSDVKTSGIGVAEVAAETMKEVIRENAEDQNKAQGSPSEPVRRSTSNPRRSDASGTSTMSFAFPILTKEESKEQKTSSVKAESVKKQQESDEKQPQTQTQTQPQTPTPAANPAAAESNWLSCLSCSFCRG